MRDSKTPENFPHCMMAPQIGCGRIATSCATCGFDRREARRRKELPLEEGPDGLMRKVVKRREASGQSPAERTRTEEDDAPDASSAPRSRGASPRGARGRKKETTT